MKKIYSTLVLLSAIAFSSGDLMGQACDNGRAFPFNIITPSGGQECFVSFVQAVPGARIALYNSGGQAIHVGDSIIRLDGSGKTYFTCGQTVAIVQLIKFNTGTNQTDIFTINNTTTNSCIAQPVEANLPIKLSGFNATLKGLSSVQLNWTSVYEANSKEFVVERSSDAKNFQVIGKVAAAGTSYQDLNYSFSDNTFSGTGYYRLKMVDLDGKSEYTKVLYVNGGSGANGTLSVFPNPFRSDVQLKGINASDVNKANIRIFSAAGKEVNFKVTGANSISIDPSVPQGIYMLRVKGQTYKLVKERN